MEAVLDDWRTAPVSEKSKATLGFLEKLAVPKGQVGPEDIEAMRAAGVSDRGIEEAIYVCFCFNVMSRLADAFEFEHRPQGALRFAGRIMYRFGYKRTSIPG